MKPLTALSNFDIEAVMNGSKNWQGVHMRDQIPRITGSAIINLDDSANAGTHWTAIYQTPREIYYFDSFGLPPPEEVLVLKGNKRLFYSTNGIQMWNSVACGYYCIMMIKQLNGGKTFYDFLYQFDQTPTPQNEILVTNFSVRNKLLR